MQYLSTSEVMIHEEALYEVYVPLPLMLQMECSLFTLCIIVAFTEDNVFMHSD